jgi:hypothetical protein
MPNCSNISNTLRKCKCCCSKLCGKPLALQTDPIEVTENDMKEIEIISSISEKSNKITEVFLETSVDDKMTNHTLDIPKIDLSNISKRSLSDFLNESYINNNDIILPDITDEKKVNTDEIIVNTDLK